MGEDELDMLRISRRKGDLPLHRILVQAFAWLRQTGRHAVALP